MSKIITTTIDSTSSVTLSPEVLNALGVETGDELAVEIVGNALFVRSARDAEQSRQFIATFDSILTKRRAAYEELAKGPDE